MPDNSIQGQCLCGKTTVTITNGETFKDQLLCHCWDCKQTSGAPFSSNVIAPRKDTKIEGPVKEYSVVAAPSGNTVTRVFCGNCGSAISHFSVAFGENAAIQTGNFKYFADKPIVQEIFTKDRFTGLPAVGGAKQLENDFPRLFEISCAIYERFIAIPRKCHGAFSLRAPIKGTASIGHGWTAVRMATDANNAPLASDHHHLSCTHDTEANRAPSRLVCPTQKRGKGSFVGTSFITLPRRRFTDPAGHFGGMHSLVWLARTQWCSIPNFLQRQKKLARFFGRITRLEAGARIVHHRRRQLTLGKVAELSSSPTTATPFISTIIAPKDSFSADDGTPSVFGRSTFRVTCQALRGTISQKDVWKPALKATCAKHRLFEPSFPMQLMSVDELRRSAMGPMRWYRMCASLTDEKRILEPRSDTFVQSFTDLYGRHGRQLHLVSGGRYMLARASEQITLWDLGCPYTQHSKHLLLDTVRFEGPQHVADVSNPVIEKSNFLRFTARVEMKTHMLGDRLQVYEVGPLPEDGRIRLLNELEIPTNITTTRPVRAEKIFDHDCVAFLADRGINLGHCVVVWNFATSLMASWRCAAKHYGGYVIQIVIWRNMVISMEESRIVGWPMPPLLEECGRHSSTNIAMSLDSHAAPRSTAFAISFDVGDGMPPERVQEFAPFLSFPHEPEQDRLIFDTLSNEGLSNDGAHVQLRRYQLEYPNGTGSGSLKILSRWDYIQGVSRTTISLSSVPERPTNFIPATVTPMMPAYWWSTTHWADWGGWYFDLTVVASATGEEVEDVEWRAVTLSDSFCRVEGKLVSIEHTRPCAASGRMVYTTRRRKEDLDDLCYLDF
ncbi:hypothetical protein NMY22_g1721 [Coprinellus aureogranulatus]|nr:hypothetical protein NMY22_g1721 [Coprinellus aureogranulatus]